MGLCKVGIAVLWPGAIRPLGRRSAKQNKPPGRAKRGRGASSALRQMLHQETNCRRARKLQLPLSSSHPCSSFAQLFFSPEGRSPVVRAFSAQGSSGALGGNKPDGTPERLEQPVRCGERRKARSPSPVVLLTRDARCRPGWWSRCRSRGPGGTGRTSRRPGGRGRKRGRPRRTWRTGGTPRGTYRAHCR